MESIHIPHLVNQGKGGKVSCDGDSPNQKSMGISSHSVAVAHLNGSLNEFCNFYRKSKHVPSINNTTGKVELGKRENVNVSLSLARVPLVLPVGATSSGFSSTAGPTLRPFGSLKPAKFALQTEKSCSRMDLENP